MESQTNFLSYWGSSLPKASGIKSQTCTTKTTASNVTVSENGRSANFLNPQKEEILKIRIDGCLVKEGKRCDWIVSKPNCVDVLVELKGTDVDHAVEQIMATLSFWIPNSYFDKDNTFKLAGLIVCSQYPKIDTKIQRAKLAIAKKYRVPLHVRARNLDYSFCDLATFSA